MRKRAILKIILFLFVPSGALFFLARMYGDDYWANIADQVWADLKSVVPSRIALTLVWLSVALILVQILTAYLSPESARKRGRPEMPALLRDLIRYGVFILLAVIILRAVWGENLSVLVGALGIGGVVLGFALQETLSNFFAGLALLAEQPFAQGDWIRIGSAPEGQVEHVTWRATKIRTRDNDYLIFPNSMVAKEIINNFRLPNVLHAIRMQIGTSYEDPPDHVKKTLLDVLGSVPSVLKNPPPVVFLKAYGDSSISYEVKCFIDNYERRPIIEDEVMNRIWYAFRRASIEIPFPIQTVYDYRLPLEKMPQKGRVDILAVLRSVPLLAALTAEEHSRLAERAGVVTFGAGEPVIRQGDQGDTLYAIVSGTARVAVRAEDGTEHDVARLTAGQVFGEMSLLTGDPRTATVYAEDWIVLCAVSKDALLPVLAANPSLAEKLAETVALRRQGLERVQQEAATGRVEQPEVQAAARSLLGRIRGFFRL